MERAGVLNIESAGCTKEKSEPGFWRRQFRQQTTRKQTIFDVLFGVVLPVLCFIFDPIVFRGNFFGGVPLFGQLQFLAYTVAFIEITTLLIWLVWRERLRRQAVALGGFLLTGALISLAIGIVLLPFSLLGLFFFGLGLLGFTPFLTFIVFWRNGRRAINLQTAYARGARKLGALVLGMIFVVGGPSAAHVSLTRAASDSVEKILEGDAQSMEAAIKRLKLMGYFTYISTDEIVWAYNREQDQSRRERLARAYMEITGKDIEMRLTFLLD